MWLCWFSVVLDTKRFDSGLERIPRLWLQFPVGVHVGSSQAMLLYLSFLSFLSLRSIKKEEEKERSLNLFYMICFKRQENVNSVLE